jgi:hypothetical protein
MTVDDDFHRVVEARRARRYNKSVGRASGVRAQRADRPPEPLGSGPGGGLFEEQRGLLLSDPRAPGR